MTKRITVYGLVQGVGFRPYVWRLAISLGLTGYVQNTGGIVEICIHGENSAPDEFARRLLAFLPAGARVDRLEIEEIKELPEEYAGNFSIIESNERSEKELPCIPADIGICANCGKELFDVQNRRFGHPFISCTDCGPRYSIIDKIPYDRQNTVMSEFALCKDCRKEYEIPDDRRCYAQTVACHDCGPKLFYNKTSDSAIERCVNDLKAGEVVAVKNIGGYHFVCDAENESAVRKLREIKLREAKPFALMFDGMDTAKEYCRISPKEEELLAGPARPIVLVDKIKDPAPSACKESNSIGAMLPADPIQMMLMKYFKVLVMTSGNISGEPIIIKDDTMEDLAKENGFFVLNHNREIRVPLDDSIVRVVKGRIQLVRRGRGYVPLPVTIKDAGFEKMFAAGGDLKASFAVACGEKVIFSQHFGDLINPLVMKAYRENREHMWELYDFVPQKIVADMHPLYFSSKEASKLGESVTVQHHLAHIASVAAEWGLDDNFTGIALDGTGYGTDGNIWGGEVFEVTDRKVHRKFHLQNVEVAGGDEAAVNGKLLLWSYLVHSGLTSSEEEFNIVRKAVEQHINTVKTSSMGRLFDAVSAMLGVSMCNRFEGDSATALENKAKEYMNNNPYPLSLPLDGNEFMVDSLFVQIKDAINNGIETSCIAAGFHEAVAGMILEAARGCKSRNVVLSGGVFMNRILLDKSMELLENEGYHVYINSQVPPNDGGIALGQLWLVVKEWELCV